MLDSGPRTATPGLTVARLTGTLGRSKRQWGTGVLGRLWGWAGDERAQRWYGKTERLMRTPSEAAEVFRWVYDIDYRSVLPSISVPTLVVARPQSDDRLLSQSRYVAEHITGREVR